MRMADEFIAHAETQKPSYVDSLADLEQRMREVEMSGVYAVIVDE